MKSKFLIFLLLLLIFTGNYSFASPTLSKNSTGKDVLTLQKKLYLIGYNITEFDGVYGAETEKAVSAFQRDQNITVTGVVTNATWRVLKKVPPIAGRKLPKITEKIESIDTKGIGKRGTSMIVPLGKTFIDSSQGTQIVATGKKYIGVPYVFGGTTPSGFDCSGFLQYVFKQHGFEIPRLADEQYKLGKSAKVSQLEPGDLVFFSTYEAGASHCGIYVGNNSFMHASSSKGIRIDSLSNEYWKPRFLGARKIIH
ncbi:MAG: C40 family peptidase [Selenomonadaceae bacterium]|nr:C40 family peptidase [Selenomonadaceae bacterium]